MSNIKGLENELRLKIDECNDLHYELSQRPIKTKGIAKGHINENYPSIDHLLIHKLRKNHRFKVKVVIEGEALWCIVIGIHDCEDLTIDWQEMSLIYLGIIDSVPVTDCVKFNDLIEFQSCDIYDIK